MNKALRKRLVSLADKYETADFLEKDPSCFMHRYRRTEDRELVAFVAAALAFGRRDQILSHVERILELAGPGPAGWVREGGWKRHFPDSSASFYRTYSYGSMRALFGTLQDILRRGTLGEYFRDRYREAEGRADGFSRGGDSFSCGTDGPLPHRHLCQVIASCFPDGCTLIPRSPDCAFKKLNMFLRWMVRDSSPVDLGLWSSWYDKADLLLPLDTHVMQEATRLDLLAPTAGGKLRAASFKRAVELTAAMGEAFPGDPVRGDYALFGLGVDVETASRRPF